MVAREDNLNMSFFRAQGMMAGPFIELEMPVDFGRGGGVKLQKATKFALFAVLELARDTSRQLSATDIADLYGISTHHLAKVLRDLGRAGLVDSVRGVGGGYRFSANARRTTLMDVICIFEDISSDQRQAGDVGEKLTLDMPSRWCWAR